MLDQQDIVILKNMMVTVLDEKLDQGLAQTEASILAKVDEKLDKRLAQTEASILAKVDEKLVKSENLILDELERTRTILEEKIGKVQKNLDDLIQYYRITKIENDNTALFLKRVDELEIRVEKLEAEQQNRKQYMDDAASLIAAQG